MIDAQGLETRSDSFIQGSMFWTLAFTSPFIESVIRARGRSLLFYFFLIRSCILESSVITKEIRFGFLFALFLDNIKSCESCIHR